MAIFFVMSKKCYRTIVQDRKVKKLQLHDLKVSSTMVWRCMTNKAWKALKRKRRRTCRHCVRRICKLYSKGRSTGKLSWCEPTRDQLDYRLRDNIQRSRGPFLESPDNQLARSVVAVYIKIKVSIVLHLRTSLSFQISHIYLVTHTTFSGVLESLLPSSQLQRLLFTISR